MLEGVPIPPGGGQFVQLRPARALCDRIESALREAHLGPPLQADIAASLGVGKAKSTEMVTVLLLDYFDTQKLTVRTANRRTPGAEAKKLLDGGADGCSSRSTRGAEALRPCIAPSRRKTETDSPKSRPAGSRENSDSKIKPGVCARAPGPATAGWARTPRRGIA